MLSVRLEEHLYEALVEGAEADGRTLSNYVARLLAESQRLRQGHSTLGASPARKSMKSKARKRVLKDVPLPGTGYSEAEDLKKGQGIIDRVTSQRRPKDTSGAPPAERVEDETEAEYFERIRVQNERQAQGVGPEPWS